MFTFATEKILEAAVAGVPRVATTIADIPPALRPQALEAVSRSYQQTLRELGYTDADAQIWLSAVMLRLRSQLAKERNIRKHS